MTKTRDDAPDPVTAPRGEQHILDDDAATQLEELIFAEADAPQLVAPSDALPIELVGPHLRLSGSVQIGYHQRLSDFINYHEGLMKLLDGRVLRRNGDPTKVAAPSIWVSTDEVTIIGQASDPSQREASPEMMMHKRAYQLIVVTPGHTLTGEVHLSAEAVLSGFIESSSPPWIPMTDVRTRSLADRRIITRYEFALLNRRQIVAATELQAGMLRGRAVL